MSRAFWDLRFFSIAIILAVASLLTALPVFAQSDEAQRQYEEWIQQQNRNDDRASASRDPAALEWVPPPQPPEVNRGYTCDDAEGFGVDYARPFCEAWKQAMEAWRKREQARLNMEAQRRKAATTDREVGESEAGRAAAERERARLEAERAAAKEGLGKSIPQDQTQKQLDELRKQLEQLQQVVRTPSQPQVSNGSAANRPNILGRNYALIIGNNDYINLPDLKTAVGDAAALSELLKLRYAFGPGDVKLLLNANKATIMDALAELRQRLKEDDRLLLYYAGHGQIDAVTEAGFWQPVDAEVGKRYTWIANDEIRREIRGLPAKHVLVLADSCFSGSLTRGAGERGEIPRDRYFTEIDSYVSRKVISSGGTEPVADAGLGGHSVFAFYLLKALRENNQPYIASFELFNKLARAVTNNSKQKPDYGTVADAGDEGSGDFTFILR